MPLVIHNAFVPLPLSIHRYSSSPRAEFPNANKLGARI